MTTRRRRFTAAFSALEEQTGEHHRKVSASHSTGPRAKGRPEHEETRNNRDFFLRGWPHMVERGSRLSLRRQSELLGLSRSSLYYTPRGASAEELALMRRLDELYLEHPFYGSRQMVSSPRNGGGPGPGTPRRVKRKPRTSVAHPSTGSIDPGVHGPRVRNIPVARVFVLGGGDGLGDRFVLSGGCRTRWTDVRALEAALGYGTPEIFNTDQGAQFTSVRSPSGFCRPGRSARWMAADGAWTTCSSNGCGGR